MLFVMEGTFSHFVATGSFAPASAKNYSCPYGGHASIKSGNLYECLNLMFMIL